MWFSFPLHGFMSKLEFSRGQQSLFGEFWKWTRTIGRRLIFCGSREDMSGLINAFKLTLTKTSFSLFRKNQKQKNEELHCTSSAKAWQKGVDHLDTKGECQQVLTLLSFLSPVSIQLRLTVLSWGYQSILGKREWFVLHFQRTASVLLPCTVMASAVKLVGSFIPLIPWRSYAFWVTMTILKHAVLFWNNCACFSYIAGAE